MANIETNQIANKNHRGFSKKYKSLSLRIDMTPMVDLGFLLITFFIFTATLSEPNTINLFMPDTKGPVSDIPESGALSIIIGKKGGFYYYEGLPAANAANFKEASLADIRKIIIDKKNEVIAKYKPDADCEAKAVANHTDPADCRQQHLMVLIKPTKDADYKNIVGVLDEMTINKIARYAIVDPEKEDLEFVNSIK